MHPNINMLFMDIIIQIKWSLKYKYIINMFLSLITFIILYQILYFIIHNL